MDDQAGWANSISSPKASNLPIRLPHRKSQHLPRASSTAMLSDNVQPIRKGEGQEHNDIEREDRGEELPDSRVGSAAADFADVHAVDAADDGDGREDVRERVGQARPARFVFALPDRGHFLAGHPEEFRLLD